MNYTIEYVTEENVDRLKKFDLSIYPINYPEKYYKEVVTNPMARVLVHKGMVVGAVSCKEKIVGCQKTLYIQSLGVLPLFRVQGIGSSLLDMAESYAEELRVDTITLHVHTRNEAAISLYKKKGFDIKETLPHYYPRLQPSSAHLMAKRL